MTDYSDLAIGNLMATIELAKQAVMTKFGPDFPNGEADMDIFQLKPDDWTSFNGTKSAEATYTRTYTVGDNTWLMAENEPYYALIFAGWLHPSLTTNLDYIQAWVGTNKTREWSGREIDLEDNDKWCPNDPFYALKGNKFRIIANVDAEQAATRDIPVVFAIRKRA